MDDHLSALLILLVCLLLLIVIMLRSRKRRAQQQPDHLPAHRQPASVGLSEPLRAEEQELIRHIRDFQDGIVREIMVPRIDLVAVEETTSLREFRLLILEKGHSRIPVYRESIDHIVGIAYTKELLRYWDADETTVTVASCMRPAYFVPESKNIGALLHEFQAHKVHMAIIIDEYGGTAGIVTIEDLLEVVFGEIVDEHDGEEQPLITVLDEQTLEVNAKAGIDQFEEHVGALELGQHDFETVGGLLLSIFRDVPKAGETVEFQRLKFTILQADRHRILQVKVERLA